MLQSLKKKTQGFTIIEVMIVLAIAALIMVIVLIAVPQLQRNQRNTSRKSIMGRIKAEFDNYAGNNNGRYPTTTAEMTSFNTRYLSGININDPQTDAPMTPSMATGGVPTAPPAAGTVQYRNGYVCNGELPTATGANPRNYAVWTGLEGGAGYCLDNK